MRLSGEYGVLRSLATIGWVAVLTERVADSYAGYSVGGVTNVHICCSINHVPSGCRLKIIR